MTPRYARDAAPGHVRDSGFERPLSERESLAALAAAGVPVVQAIALPREGAAEAAMSAARSIGGPVVVKLDADVAHKTDVGGVVVGVEGEGVRAAVDAVLEAGRRAGVEVRGVLVQPEIPPLVELIVGARRDPTFGPVVVVGLGGVLAEVLDDVAIRLAPVTPVEARTMFDELRGARVLRGVRGRQPVDLGNLAAFVASFSRAFADQPEWSVVDMNPVVVGPGGPIAVDALIIASDPIR